MVVAVAGLAGFGLTSAVGGGSPSADLEVLQDVPDDVRAELDTTWNRFVERFPARRTCTADVAVLLVAEVEGGDARYVAGDARIEIQIPTTPARFRESFAHELAHHVERTCAEFDVVRPALLDAIGGTDWFEGDTWEAIPSESWAEAVVLVLNGERVRHHDELPLDDRVVDLVRRWGRGDPLG